MAIRSRGPQQGCLFRLGCGCTDNEGCQFWYPSFVEEVPGEASGGPDEFVEHECVSDSALRVIVDLSFGEFDECDAYPAPPNSRTTTTIEVDNDGP